VSRRYRWRIDETEGEVATVEVDGRLLDVPRALLPAGAGEDAVLAVEVEDRGAAVTVRIAVDAAATAEARRRATERLERLREGDARGDLPA
jgi:hypothetical protein